MEMTTLTINLPKNISSALEDEARISGKNIAEYVEELLSKQVNRPTFRELFADVRKEIKINDEDLAKEIDDAIGESRKARRGK